MVIKLEFETTGGCGDRVVAKDVRVVAVVIAVLGASVEVGIFSVEPVDQSIF